MGKLIGPAILALLVLLCVLLVYKIILAVEKIKTERAMRRNIETETVEKILLKDAYLDAVLAAHEGWAPN